MLTDDLAYSILKTKDYGKSMLWFSKLLLGSILMWPNTKTRRLSIVSCIILEFTGVFTLVGIILYIHANIHVFNKMAYGMCLLVVPVLSMFKLPVICYKLKEISDLLRDIDLRFWPYDVVDDDTKNYLRDIYKLTIIFMIWIFILGQSYVVMYVVLPFFTSERTLPFLCGLPAWNESPHYEIIFVIQVIFLQFPTCHGVLGTDYLVFGICEGLANQYRILQKCFLAFNTEKMIEINKKLKKVDNVFEGEYDINKEYFLRCIKHHDFLLSFAKKMNEALSPLELGQLIISVSGICLGIFILSRPDTSNIQFLLSIIYITGFAFQLSIDCIVGTDLYYQAMLIPDCIFNSNWMAIENEEFKKDVIFAIQHSQRYPQFTAYTLYDMNMNSYAKVLKMAFSIYTFLTKISD